ncbi:hypothetical protein GCM10009716_31960 [Streptomyces sodiiphilus]|uniref:eCIS core domain-containing protein n=1 Tax=Streptomyces sodiiphilus TaxID=226217 RepID=A0ABP5ARM7_9ACTN
MSTTRAPARDGRSPGEHKRRRGTSRPGGAATVPEPREIVGGAGRPLDPAVRRELEERLGHDFGRVRVHTDRDAAGLAALLGADAVTVGEDIFFAENTFRPGTESGRALLAHELLHTVQAPETPGALRTGRGLGAVSLPENPAEHEAETGARTDPEQHGQPGGPEVSRRPTPGWLRYATADADRMRTERLDPATLVDRLTAGIVRSLRGDPADTSHRVRLQLARLSPELRDAVLAGLERRLPSSEHTRLRALVEESLEGPCPLDSAAAPMPLPGTAEGDEEEREPEEREGAAEQDWADRDYWAGEEQAEERPPGGRQESGAASPGQAVPGGDGPAAAPAADGEQGRAGGREQGQPGPGEQGREETGEGPEERSQEEEQQEEEQEEEREDDDGQRQEDEGQEQETGDDPGQQAENDAAAPPRVSPEDVEEDFTAGDGPLARHGPAGTDDSPREEEEPIGLAADAGQEISGIDSPPAGEPDASDDEPALRPEDFLPATDLDLSSVPTLDDEGLSPGSGASPAPPAMPSFPAPPPTRAELVEEARARRDAHDEEGPEPEPGDPESGVRPGPADDPARESGPEDSEAPDGETLGTTVTGGPAAGPVSTAGIRSEQDLQPRQSVEQEVGPDPESSQERLPEDPGPAPAVAPAADTAGSAGADREQTRDDPPATREDSERDGDGPDTGDTASLPEPSTNGTATRGSSLRGRATPSATRSAARERAGAEGRADAAPAPAAAFTSLSTPDGTAEAALTTVGPAEEQAHEPGTVAESAPDASMEPGGGECGGDQQAGGEEPEAAAECGGGGGEGEQKQMRAQVPDVSGQDPSAAVATAGTLPADRMLETLDGVDDAVERESADLHRELENAPPEKERPAGAPQTLHGEPHVGEPAEQVTERVRSINDVGEGEQERPEGEKILGSRDTTAPRPHVSAPGGEVSAEDVASIEAAVDAVPDTDPALNRTVGPAPKVELTGDSDPGRTDEQAGHLEDTTVQVLEVGRADAATPMGEDQIYPDVPPETLAGDVPGRSGGEGGGGQAGAEAAAVPGLPEVAEEEHGDEIDATVARARGDMATAYGEQEQGRATAEQQTEADIAQAEAENSEEQAGRREQVRGEVEGAREQLRADQDEEIEKADEEATEEYTGTHKEIDEERQDTDRRIEDRKDDDNEEIQEEREAAEQKAARKKKEEKKGSGGFFGWVASKVSSFFDTLLAGITAIFDAARAVVNGIIEGFRTFANAAIDAMRDLAVILINVFADALIALGDVLLAAFPELRDRFRDAVDEWRDSAIESVNILADALKDTVNAFLDDLAGALSALLNVLEAGLRAAVEFVREGLRKVVEMVKAAINAFGQFAVIAGHIAPDPGGWLSRMGSSAKEGVSDHLWPQLKAAVRQWFDAKVQGVLGLGRAVIDTLRKGCVSMKEIGRKAWEAILASLPMMIVMLVIEKLISLIVPAAGAILTIVQGLKAAWASISSIIAAIGAFIDYLKAVRAGPAACLFAKALALGAVALLDFIANFLLERIGKPLKAVGNGFKKLAKTIGKGLRKTGRGTRKAAGAATNAARADLRKAQTVLTTPPRSTTPPKPTSPTPSSAPTTSTPRPSTTGTTPSSPTTSPSSPTTSPSAGPSPTASAPTKPATPTPATSRPKRPETTRPKPAKPRKPVSPTGRALAASRSAVRRALQAVRRARRALGRRLRTSRVGRALTRSARTIRNSFRSLRTRLRDRSRLHTEQKRQRRQEGRKARKSKESKEARLRKIVARISPRLKRMLDKGVRRPVLKATLAGLKTWNRLRQLAIQGTSQFDIRALLNPGMVTVAGVRIDSVELIRFIRKAAADVQEFTAKKATRRDLGFGDDKIMKVDRHTAQSNMIAEILRRGLFKTGRHVIQHIGKLAATVGLSQWRTQNPRNYFISPYGRKEQTEGEGLGHKYRSMFKNLSEQKQVRFAIEMLADLRGNTKPRRLPKWRFQRLYLHTLHAVEENRSPSDLVYRALAYDAAKDRKRSLQEMVNIIPMTGDVPKGAKPTPDERAQRQARFLNFHLEFEDLKKQKTRRRERVDRMMELTKSEGFTVADMETYTKTKRDEKEETEDAYMRKSWQRIAKEGNFRKTEAARRMERREIDFLTEWASLSGLDFSESQNGKRELFALIEKKIRYIYGVR